MAPETGRMTYALLQSVQCYFALCKPGPVLFQTLLQGADFAVGQLSYRVGVGDACFLDGIFYPCGGVSAGVVFIY